MGRASRSALAWGTLLVVLAGVLPHLGTLGHGFTLDDASTICGHKGVQGPLAWDDVVRRDWWGRSRFDSIGTWRPLATLTFWCDRVLGGGRPWIFHATNVVLYAALLLLLERFLRRWCVRALSDVARLLAVLVFGTLAIHADVVPSPTGRAELLAALFSLAALYAATCTRTLGWRQAALASGGIFVALLAKESAAPMAILVPLLAHRAHFERRTFRRGAMIALALASPVALAIVWAFRVIEMPFMALSPARALENPLLAVDSWHRVLGALDVAALYLRHTLAAGGLAPDYSFSEPPLLRDGPLGVALGGAAMAACLALVVVSWRRAPRIADAALGLGASYLTGSNLVVAASAIADRLFFFPSMWLVILVALVADRSLRATRARTLACGAVLVFAGVQGVRAATYAALWRDDVTLLGAAARAYPNVFRTQRNLAHALSDEHASEDAAWHLAIAEAIYASYPSPVARDAIAPAWDAETLANRLGHLRDAFGAPAACSAATVAAERLRSWDDAPAADSLAPWLRATCSP